MNLQSNDFEILGLAPSFGLDAEELSRRWKALQAQVHPDRFVASSAAEKRVAMQWSVRINEAYQRLREPLERAAYLCELHGVSLGEEDNTAMPPAFLMQQLEWREALDDAKTLPELNALQAEVQQFQQSLFDQAAHALDAQQDYAVAAQHVRALMFLARFLQAVQARLRVLADATESDMPVR